LAVAFFVLALIVRLSGVGDRAEKRWYDARAAAESVKSSAWQFAVGGEAFRISDLTAAQRFRESLGAVLETLPTLDVPAPSNTDAVITQKMGSLRSSDIANRAKIYLKERVEDQVHWYATKANWNKRRASQWRWILIGVDAAAICLGVLRATAVLHVNWLGIFAVAATGVAAWQQTKNYRSLSEAYSVTSHEVNIVSGTLTAPADEDAWAQAVHDAEAAFSREHTLWLARRQGPRHLSKDHKGPV
jgi:hypothetical protein